MNHPQPIFRHTQARAALLVAGVLSGACAFGGCTTQVDAPLPEVYMNELLEGGEVAPACGTHLPGSLNARVPLRGVTSKPGDVITAYVYHYTLREWVEVGQAKSDELPLAQMADHPIYGFDLGEACATGCELSLPTHAWAGFGPFEAHFRLYSEADGWLLAHAADAACAGEDPTDIVVHAEPNLGH